MNHHLSDLKSPYLPAGSVIRDDDEWECDGSRSAGSGRRSDDQMIAGAHGKSFAGYRRSPFAVARARFRLPISPIRQMKRLGDKRQEILFALPPRVIRVGQFNLRNAPVYKFEFDR